MLSTEDKINRKIDKMIVQDASTACGTPGQCEEAKEQAFKLQEDYKEDLQITGKDKVDPCSI